MGFAFDKIFSSSRIPARYYVVTLILFVSLHLLLSNTHDSYGRVTSLSKIAPAWLLDHTSCAGSSCFSDSSTMKDQMPHPWHLPQIGTANGTFVILSRNSEVRQLVKTLQQVEDRFNHRYHYPFVFLNDEPFSDEFKKWTSAVVSSKVAYGIIPPEYWNQPDHIDEEKAKANRWKLKAHGTANGDSVSYRNMCRFYSGFFFRHELLQQYRYYWRIEPGTDYSCDIEEDPLAFMQENKKLYGFTITLPEDKPTVPTLWNATKEFIKENPQYISPDNAMRFISDDDGESWNYCQLWSNLEIADIELWRTEAYTKYFEYLDSQGGFYYERWGDAPIHTLAVALFARKDKIHRFMEIGYRHPPFEYCPQGQLFTDARCTCIQENNNDGIPINANGIKK